MNSYKPHQTNAMEGRQIKGIGNRPAPAVFSLLVFAFLTSSTLCALSGCNPLSMLNKVTGSIEKAIKYDGLNWQNKQKGRQLGIEICENMHNSDIQTCTVYRDISNSPLFKPEPTSSNYPSQASQEPSREYPNIGEYALSTDRNPAEREGLLSRLYHKGS
ncbi:hypothetical protein HZB88_01050 [archaeon]|nr:hypothetical protein [archaeon]